MIRNRFLSFVNFRLVPLYIFMIALLFQEPGEDMNKWYALET
jgi:hypothetical protein